MSNLRVRNKQVAVEKSVNSAKEGAFLFIPDSNDSVGVITHISSEVKDLKVGDKVYYGDKRTQIVIGGKDVLIMNEENVLAVVES